MNLSFFYYIPLTFGALIMFAFLLTALEAGYRAGFARRKKWRDADTGGGTVALSTMFALLGLILAFTYASGVSRFEDRKQVVIEESNALGTAFLRAGLIADPGGKELQETILAYAKTRVIDSKRSLSHAETMEVLNNTMQAQEKLWPTLEKALMQGKPGAIESSMIAAMNDVLDMHTIRLAALMDKLPNAVIWMLIFISAATTAVTGFNAGLSGKISRWRTATLALVMTGVMLMILDYDRPRDGFIRVNQDSLITVIADMEKNLAK
ncbi:MAG: hypothetical protein KJO03_04100 [Gammaproteobacteria bacterium]|nr:hypothetical protein [Gammaproteobacteria bacterium]